MSYSIHSQDEDQYSTDYNAMSPSRTYFLPITPQKTMLPRPSATLPRPSRIPISKTRYTTQTQHKDKLITQKTKSSPRPSRIPVLNNNRHNQHLRSPNQKHNRQSTAFQDHQRKPFQSNLHKSNQHLSPDHHSYQHHQHTTDGQPAQGHQHPPTAAGIPLFQDHRQ